MANYPVYFLLGQEIFLGDLQEEWLTENHDDRWDDAEASIDVYDYQAAGSTTYDTTPASANSNTQQAADTDEIGLDVSLYRYLLDNDHPTGVAFVKRTDQGAVGNSGSSRWGKTYSESYANIATPYNALVTTIQGRGDTVDAKGFFLGFGYAEGVIGNTTLDSAFEADLATLIADLREDYGNGETTPVVMDLPPASVTGFTSTQNDSLVSARRAIKKLASEDAYLTYVSADDLQRSNGATKWYYTGEATITQGERMAKAMSNLLSATNTTGGAGAPVYVMLGDDNVVGTVPNDYLDVGAAATEGDAQDTVKTWDWANNSWESLNGSYNSNTSTDGTTTFGPDVSMGSALAEKHPGKTVYIFKLGRSSSSVSDAAATGGSWPEWTGDIYDEVEAAWGLAKAAMVNTEGYVPDVRGLTLLFGQEDLSTQTRADAYLNGILTCVDDYRSLFQTNVNEDLPVALVRPQDTGAYTTEYAATVREACTVASERDGNVTVVEIDNYSVNADGQSLSGGGLLDTGTEIAAAF